MNGNAFAARLEDLDTRAAVAVQVVIKGVPYRNAVSVLREDPRAPLAMADGLETLAKWIRDKVAEAGA
jgi:hypothetical protein